MLTRENVTQLPVAMVVTNYTSDWVVPCGRHLRWWTPQGGALDAVLQWTYLWRTHSFVDALEWCLGCRLVLDTFAV